MKNDNKYLSEIKLRETERQLSFNTIRVRYVSLLFRISQVLTYVVFSRYIFNTEMEANSLCYTLQCSKFTNIESSSIVKKGSCFYASLIINFFHEK